MRILIPTIDYPPIEGGISTVALNLSRTLAARGHEVTVVAPDLEDMRAFDEAEPVRVVRFQGYDRGWLRIIPFLRAAWPEAQQADAILAINIAYGGPLAWWTHRRRGVPYVTFAYAYEFLKFQKAWPVAAFFRRVYRRARTTIVISTFTQYMLERFGVPRDAMTRALPGAPPAQPVDQSAVAAVREAYELGDEPFVLSVGRMIPRKGQLTLVDAWPAVLEACPNTHLVIAGRGPDRARCRDRAAALGIEAFVHLPGYVDDATCAALYHACAFFALPTGMAEGGHVEGFGLVFAEAAAYGKPSVAGQSGGVPDAVLHEETGLLVPPGDTHATADAIIRLLNDTSLRDQLGAAAKARVEDTLNWERFTVAVLEALA
jgi:phosphatidylinositol alpha-1,6-mannosyltransferase